MANFIEYRGIKKAFVNNAVLKRIDLTVREAETLVILGGSGSGKSVLLKLTIGLLKPDEGQILIKGKDITEYSELEWTAVRRQVSYMFQRGALFDSMSVYDNVAFPLRESREFTKGEIELKVMDKLELIGLSEFSSTYPADLSGGMRKRVALARSIVTEPACILYDEPTSGLDPITADTINKLIRRMQSLLGVTSIVVTHDINSMFYVADRLSFLHEGEMAFIGTPEEARSTNNIVLRGFIEGRNPDEPEF